MAEERISYGEISNSCSSLTNLASSLSGTIDSINSAIGQITDPTWAGAAASSYVEKIKGLVKHLPEAKRQLAEAVLFLASCADGYKSIDQASVAKLKELIGGQEYIDNYDVNSAPDIDLSSRVSLKDDTSGNKDLGTEGKSDKRGRSTGGGSSGGGYSGGGYSGGGSSGGGYSGGGGGIAGVAAATAASNKITPKDKDKKKEETKKKEKDKKILSLKAGETLTIPNSVNQDVYQENNYITSKQFAESSKEAEIYNKWKANENFSAEGIAIINTNNEERYLVKVSPKYGAVGDNIDITLSDGNVLKCTIAESKSVNTLDKNYYGTDNNGKINIVEFETASQQGKINYSWDTNTKIKKVTNNGSVQIAKSTAEEAIDTVTGTKEEAK